MTVSTLTPLGSRKPRALVVEDHQFFAREIVEYLAEDRGFEVVYASNFLEAVKMIKKDMIFDFAILDILLQNGKTGVDIAEKYKEQLGRIMFVTGCVDETVLSKITEYASASKLCELWTSLESFIAGGCPKINSNDTETYESTTQVGR